MKHLIALIVTLFCAVHAQAEHPVEFQVQLLAIDANEGCAIADYDDDGKLDISAGRNWYRNPGSKGTWVPRPVRLIEDKGGYVHSNGEYAYDVDGDGLTDVVAGSFWLKPVHWYKNPGKDKLKMGHLWKQNLLVETNQNTNEIGVLMDVDLNDDGKPEWLANQWNKNAPLMIWYRDEKGQFKGHQVGPKNGHGIGLGDINNDGRDDILVGSGWYERPKGNPYAGPWTYHADWDRQFSCPMIVRDVNSDGKNDIIFGNPHNFGVFVWISEGFDGTGKFKHKEVKLDESWSQAHAIHMADLDGDGKDELITGKRVFGHNGRDPGAKDPPILVYYTWDKKFDSFKRHVIAEGNVGIGLQIRTADLDADGDNDIVVAGKDGTQIVWNKRK
ncbi:MAG: VCBS repeat-containing protein [Phycisphaeraceae bacterium]|nr:VCBS repeat-containing protein [Phycisphaeraceae bacterium]